MPKVLDQYDLKILTLLQKNAKMDVKALAKAVHLSESPVRSRKKVLESTYIKSNNAILHKDLFNINIIGHALIKFKNSSSAAMARTKKMIIEMPFILRCATTTGDFDLAVTIGASDMNAFTKITTKDILQDGNVEHLYTYLEITELKDGTTIDLTNFLH
ncbi:MAG: Lrp/AsnC family transcriptional regulator [Bacteroidota bacterium]